MSAASMSSSLDTAENSNRVIRTVATIARLVIDGYDEGCDDQIRPSKIGEIVLRGQSMMLMMLNHG